MLLSVVCAPTEANVYYTQIIESVNDWTYTTGWHSDGTSIKVRYYDTTYQIYYKGCWNETVKYYDREYNRYYVKTPANKRYYI